MPFICIPFVSDTCTDVMTPASNWEIVVGQNIQDANKLKKEGDKWDTGIGISQTVIEFFDLYLLGELIFIKNVVLLGAENIDRFSLVAYVNSVCIFYLVFSICRAVCYACLYTILCM